VLEDLINQEIHQRIRLLGTYLDGADMALGFGPDVPHLPGRPGLLHGGQHPVGGLRDPVGVGHTRRPYGWGKGRRDHRGDAAGVTKQRCGFTHPRAALLGK
jgi:hypothetical protein